MAATAGGGEVTVKVRLDGPYKVTGPVTVLDESGAVLDHDGVSVLCRCGRSGTPPHCDLSHRRRP